MAVAFVGLVLYATSLPAALLCVVLRFRAARGVERQQLRWVVAGGVIAGLALLPLPGMDELHTVLGILGVVIVPMSVAVAVLRYRLYDLDRIISRTLAYGLLTVLLGLGYAAVVLLGGRFLPGSSSLTVAAALAVAALFSPLRRRVQNLVDRRFNRRRYDAARTVEGSRPACATRWTWTCCTPSCWPWSTRQCSRRWRPCGCDHRDHPLASPAGRDRAMS